MIHIFSKRLVATIPTFAVLLAATRAEAAPLGQACFAQHGFGAACIACVTTNCTAAPQGQTICFFENAPDCLPPPVIDPKADTVPDFELETLPEIDLGPLLIIATAAAGGYVIYEHRGKLWTRLMGPRFAPGFAMTFAIIGLPILIGEASGQAFNDYVDNYAPCVNPVWNGNEYVCLGNSVLSPGAPGSPGSQCPPGTQPQTSYLGTACVESAVMTIPPPPSCASLQACGDPEEGVMLPENCDGVDVEVECFLPDSSMGTGTKCISMCRTEMDGGDLFLP